MKINLQNHKWAFIYKDKEFLIPSELFPLTFNEDDTNIYAITESQVSEISDVKILEILDGIPLSVGRCYEDSNKIYHALKNEGYNVGYFSGWLFIGQTLPIHHAWVALEHEGAMHIIDAAENKISALIAEDMHNRPFESEDETRRAYVEIREKLLNEKKRNTDRITTGKPPIGYAYIGTDNNFDETIKTYKSLSKIKNHPAYEGGMNISGDSVMQKMIKETETK